MPSRLPIVLRRGLLAAFAGLPLLFTSALPAHAATQQNLDWFGPTLLPNNRIISYYGNPLSASMGILGSGTSQEVIARLRQQEAAYVAADPTHPTIGALELVAVVAQRSPGPNGYYSLRMPYSLIEQELKIARLNHLLLILDVQIGHATVQSEVQYLARFLKQPDVELALDPEFAMKPGDIPGIEFGSMPTPPINWALAYLQGLVRQYHLPQKILILHQFIESMVPDWQGIQEQPNVVLVRDMDGFGGQQLKMMEYERFIHQEAIPYVAQIKPLPGAVPGVLNEAVAVHYQNASFVAGGIKLFYTQDKPLMRPSTVLSLDPPPLVVIYQ
ncbi:MAG: hypothetical protein M0Z66_10410 [Thermaerobacter sp.]|nr:hypothetical protein [Thermaerobacter sp.]